MPWPLSERPTQQLRCDTAANNCGSNCPANHTTVTLANLDPDERTDGSSYRFSNCCTVSVPNRSTHTCADIGANRSADS